MINKPKYNLLLADDDTDDCTFFKDALEDLPISTTLITVSDGVQLMKYLIDTSPDNLPDILFLDLNMPRKNGFECLTEIKTINKLEQLPVIIFSTSLDMNIVDLLYEKGAIYYIQKPAEYSKLRKVVLDALTVGARNNFKQPTKNNFILQP